MAIQLGSAYGKIVIDSSGVKVGVDGAMKSLGTLQQVANKVGDSMQKIGAAMTIGLTLPIVGFFASSVKSAMEAESALAEVEAVLKSTGGAAGVTSEEVQKLATDFQKLTKFSDEQIMSGESMLLTFTKIGKDVFPIATEAMLNMAEKFGSIETASIQLGKALNDPIAGVSALRRVGVMLSDQQEKQIKDFMAVNDIASAQKVILKELEVEFGGLAKAAGDTAAGKFAQFKNTLDDFKEVIGAAIIPSLIRFMDALTPILIALSELPPGVTDSIVAFFALVAVSGPLISVLETLLKGLALFLPGGALAGVGTFFTTTLLPAFSTFFAFITATAIPAIIAFAAANAWWIVPLLLIAATVYLVYLAFKNNFMGITTTLQQAAFLVDVWVDQTSMAFTKWVDETSAVFAAWVDGMKAKFDMFVNTVKERLNKVVNFFKGIGVTANQIGNIFQMVFIGGISRAIDWVVSKIERLKAALASIKLPKALTPGSPTPFEMGLRGIASAMDMLSSKNLPQFSNAMSENAIARTMARPAQNMSSSQSTSTTMNFANGLTLRDVDAMMDEKIKRFVSNAMGGR